MKRENILIPKEIIVIEDRDGGIFRLLARPGRDGDEAR